MEGWNTVVAGEVTSRDSEFGLRKHENTKTAAKSETNSKHDDRNRIYRHGAGAKSK